MLIHTILLLLFLIEGSIGCMAGYEAERDKLREHLGIEWVPHGLDNTAWSSKAIRHSNDLDCNFSDSKKCLWKNMEDKWNMDSLDFHLFEKTDYTEFPALRVGPGPTKINQGDKMIFTGDRKREEQHAIYYSSPIGCQNSTGNLTFTYWVYNSARVEVVLLEDLPQGGYKAVYEKPYVDCGTININTECHVEIPPRVTPFRIGIRAYEMSTKEGSFVMLDNINYQASLCKVAIDLGDEFTSTPIYSSAQGISIQNSADLKCSNFDEKCRWRSGGKTKTSWMKSSSTLPKDFLYNTTGNYVAPQGKYAILYIEQGKKQGDVDFLRSDPISCQSQTENALSFRFWKTKEAELEVCAVNSMEEDLECIDVASGNSPAPVKISFKIAAKNFMIEIRLKSFNSDFDSAIIIDDISYEATLCTDALSVFDLGEHFLATPMLSILMNRHINSAKELFCDFSRRAAECSWSSTAVDENEQSEIASSAWTVGHGPLNKEKFFSLTRSSDLPAGEFGVARMETGGTTMLLSEAIKCVINTITLQFNLWTTGSATLEVCVVDELSPSLLDCQPAAAGVVVVDLPPIDRPFRIALRASSPDQGMVIVDNISLQGEVCPSILRQFSSKSFRPSSDVPDPNVCRLLTCDFSRGYSCLYESRQIPNSAIHNVENNNLVTRLTKERNVAILESPPFRLNTISRLHFKYIIEGDLHLYVCNDSAKKELESCYKVVGKVGDDYIEMLPSDTKVYLIARLTENGLSGNLTLSNLQLSDVADNNAC